MDIETLKKAVKLKRDLDVFSKEYEYFEKALTGKELNVNIDINSRINRGYAPSTIRQSEIDRLGLKEEFDNFLKLGKAKTSHNILIVKERKEEKQWTN